MPVSNLIKAMSFSHRSAKKRIGSKKRTDNANASQCDVRGDVSLTFSIVFWMDENLFIVDVAATTGDVKNSAKDVLYFVSEVTLQWRDAENVFPSGQEKSLVPRNSCQIVYLS